MPTINLPQSLFVILMPLVDPWEEASSVLLVLPELLYGLGGTGVTRATELVLALYRYFECAKEPGRATDGVDAEEWRADMLRYWGSRARLGARGMTAACLQTK